MITLRSEQSNWVYSIPNSSIMIPRGWNHDSGHNGGDVESRPLEHELIEECLFSEVGISSFSHFVLNRDSSGIVDWIGLVTVVVSLNEEPSLITEFIEGMDCINISFNYHTFVTADT